jgi:hypothetical protein
VTTGAEPPPRGRVALPGLTPAPDPLDGQGLLPGMAGLAGVQDPGPALIADAAGLAQRGGRADAELGRVAAELLAADPDGARIGAAVRNALDMLLDGQHTGRYRWDQLCKTEKTHAGTLVEIGVQRRLALADGDLLDYSIAGTDVDCKFSHQILSVYTTLSYHGQMPRSTRRALGVIRLSKMIDETTSPERQAELIERKRPTVTR